MNVLWHKINPTICGKMEMCFCSLGIFTFFFTLNGLFFPTAGYVLKDCWITRHTQAICKPIGRTLNVFPKDIPARVTTMDLSVNKISKLNNTDLEDLPNLLHIDLTENRISEIESGTFAGQISLEVLILNKNKL
jgi:hypothetical protein